VRRWLLGVGAAALAALGVALGVWAAGPGGGPECRTETFVVEDSVSPKMMTYRRQDCGDGADPPPGYTGP
jgi:hypothetical protein